MNAHHVPRAIADQWAAHTSEIGQHQLARFAVAQRVAGCRIDDFGRDPRAYRVTSAVPVDFSSPGTTARSKSKSSGVLDALHNVHQMAYRVRDALLDGDLTAFGMLLHETWQQKKHYAKSVSTPEIDEAYASWAADDGRFPAVASPLARIPTGPPWWQQAAGR